jgi:hypothetical protein
MQEKSKMAKNNKRDEYESGGVAFVGCILIGVGIGLFYSQIAVGTLIGTGIGFVAMALLRR